MVRFTEPWVLLKDNEPIQDPVTGNWFPTAPTEIPWTGLLQQRQLSASSVDAGSSEIESGHVVASYELLLNPGIPEMPARRDRFRDASGVVYQVVGNPRVRKPARGSRRPAYIAAIVRNSSDLEE